MLRTVLGRIRSLISPSSSVAVGSLSPASSSRRKSNELTVIAKGVDVTGKLLGLGAVDIVGSFDGNIFADIVSIRAGGLVTGSVVANSVTVNGRLDGQVMCQNIAIGSTGFVKGVVSYTNILIEDNGVVSGDCRNLGVTEQQIMDMIDKELAGCVSSDGGASKS